MHYKFFILKKIDNKNILVLYLHIYINKSVNILEN